MNNNCKEHNWRLKKVDGKIQLVSGRNNRVIIPDVEYLLSNITVHTNGKSTSFDFPEGYMKIRSNDEFVGLKSVLYNDDVDNWMRIYYKHDNRKDHIKSIVLTTDHPLPIESGEVKRADELVVGDKLIRVNIKHQGSGMQPEYAEIVKIEKLDRVARSYDVTTENGYFDINKSIYSHNCRSFLTPDYIHYKYYGRFNQGVCTINLVDVGLSAVTEWNRLDDRDRTEMTKYDLFWTIFDERLDLCYDALMERHKRLMGTKSDAAPILWQHGCLSRLDQGETIDKLLFDNYSTISLGYAGLYECVKAMTGKSHTDPEITPFALQIMQHMNDKCAEWRAKENISFSLYGTPLESTTYRFATCLQKRFGVIEGITDKSYITNSYHVHVTEEIDAFSKLSLEAKFQALSPGGAISYVEVPNMQNNIPAVLAIMKHIYNNIMYAELNTKSDYCQVCGFDGEIRVITDENGRLVWECPECGNRNQDKLNVVRRTCGYLGSQFWNQGRTEEIRDRVLHVDLDITDLKEGCC